MTFPVALSRAAAAWLLALPLVVPPAAAQPPAADTSARPPRVPPRGPVPREPAVERRLQADVKAPDGFSVTLFAGPPVAMYPTCVGESPDGALFVCVDPNLSLSTYKNVGRVMRLVDDDRDGRADRYTTFAQMDSPRGVATDGRTVYVMHPPSLTAYRDTTGDGIADEARDIVTGLGFDLDFRGADHTTNNVALGADGWLYVAVGDYGFIKAVGSDGTQLQHRGGAVVRVRPDGTGLELYATGTRNIYDVALDPFMNAFARDNTNDGDGWDTRLHYLAPGADMGYPARYQNFPTEHFPSLKDYGAGAGVGSLWVQDPALPAGYNNTLYTGDWTLNKIFRHPLTPKGAIFEAGQNEFLSVVRPADLVMDAQSNLYVASLAGGQFTYNTDTVGYVFRVTYGGAGAPPARGGAAPAALARQTDAQLVAALATANAVGRLHASQELVRRGARPATVAGLQRLALDSRQSAESRAAAIFTLKQAAGAGSHATLQQLAADADARVRAVALRALADRRDQLDGVPAALYVRALGDADAHVQTQAINGLVRLGARTSADALVPLAGSPDQALAHLAVHALAALGARDAALRAVDGGAPAVRAGALRALAMMHDQATADALVERAARTTDPAARRPLLVALARLHNREGYWAGDWWTTKPAHLGPYFDPAAWEASPQIRRTLAAALTAATGAEFDTLATDLVRNQVLPRGAAPLLAALTAARDPQRADVITAMVGRSQLDPSAVTLVATLDARRPALHGAVARLLAGEGTVTAGGLPLVRAAALDPALDADVRAQLLSALAQVPGPAGLDAAAEVFARLNPEPGAPATATGAAAAAAAPTPPAGSAPAATGGSAGTGTGTSAGLGNGTTNASANAGTGAGANATASGNAASTGPGGAAAGGDAVAAAWRRFVGDRRRMQELDRFVDMARAGDPSQRTLAYAVLVQAVRSPRAPAPVRAKVAPVLDAAWSDPRSAPSLVRAITLMRVESQYRERLDAYQSRQPRGES